MNDVCNCLWEKTRDLIREVLRQEEISSHKAMQS